ncbi:MAG: SDR family NAD(P)-dependent oxidoreductase [Syntrophomonadaceae bacterium]|nr:SDR family NAD(P)-dependent oxidoreductase [Syntrophomonadaceae bacterium]
MEYTRKTAVITGAASGLGLGIARACAARNMKLVLADINRNRLDEIGQEFSNAGVEVLTRAANVAEVDDMERLAHLTFERFGAVHLLFNNAGVLGESSLLDAMLKDWEWIMGVNLWGVINSIRAFVPRMLESGEPGRVVNIAGTAGFLSGPGVSIYRMTKHAVVSLSESLYHELTDSSVQVSLVSPAFVKTEIMAAEKNRPPNMQCFARTKIANPVEEAVLGFFQQQVETAPDPEVVAEAIFSGIDQNKFYIFAPPLAKDQPNRAWIQTRMDNIVEERNPVFAGKNWPV